MRLDLSNIGFQWLVPLARLQLRSCGVKVVSHLCSVVVGRNECERGIHDGEKEERSEAENFHQA